MALPGKIIFNEIIPPSKFSLKTYVGETGDTIFKRMKFLRAIEEADISNDADEVDRIMEFYARDIQQISVPPPALPPRPDELSLVYDLFAEIRSTKLNSRRKNSTSSCFAESEGEQNAENERLSRKNAENESFKRKAAENEKSRRKDEQHVNTSVTNDPFRFESELETSLSGAIQGFKPSPSQSIPVPISSRPIQLAQKHILPQSLDRPTPTIRYNAKSGAGLGPTCRILVVDAVDNYPSALVQYYLEFFRVWTANTGGPWIFRRIQCAYVQGSDFQLDSRRSNPIRTKLTKTSSKFCHDHNLIKNVLSKDRSGRYYEAMSDEPDHILNTLRRDKFRPINRYNLRNYDYIIASHLDQAQTLEQYLHQRSVRLDEKSAQVLVLSMPIKRRDARDPTDMMGVAFESIAAFLESNFGWQYPQHPYTQAAFRTIFVRAKLIPFPDQSELDRQFRKAEQDSGCALHWTSHLGPEDERILAIVGLPGLFAGAKRVVNDVLIKYNWGYLPSYAILGSKIIIKSLPIALRSQIG